MDSFKGEVNAHITVYGDRIKIKISEEFKDEAGLFFINLDNQSRTKITQLINNENKAVIFMTPALSKVNYELELVTQRNRNALLKTPRSEKLTTVLIIN
ncbi:DUF4469 domain-containing protein [Flammeovirga sp. SJP92]|uniref:DUF4469 domain-containing protein n=1 Tax=Flammeovirga sp. SJP92 TaxID=1775430 RepID=UPI00155FDB93|nr:DUF4469 domain-containing protein [Flammeovirga sp. SJP92]